MYQQIIQELKRLSPYKMGPRDKYIIGANPILYTRAHSPYEVLWRYEEYCAKTGHASIIEQELSRLPSLDLTVTELAQYLINRLHSSVSNGFIMSDPEGQWKTFMWPLKNDF